MKLFEEPADREILLVLRALKLGDLLVAVPAIRGLRRAFPDHELVLAVPGWLAPIVDLVPGVDSLLPTPGLNDPLTISSGIVDVAVNMHGNGGESARAIEALGARTMIAHRVAGHEEGPQWLDGILERRRWVRLVSSYGVDADEQDVAISVPAFAPVLSDVVAVHVGAFYGSRRWPVERFAQVIAALLDDGERVVITGSEAERERALEVAELASLPVEDVLAGVLDLGEFAALIASSRLVISADTGAAHLASAYGVRSVVLFGPAPVEEWGPPVNGLHIVLTDARQRRGDTFGDEPDPALLAVHSSQVIDAARALLAGLPLPAGLETP